MTRRTMVAALLAALALAGCGGGSEKPAGAGGTKAGPPIVTENYGYVDAHGCWGDYTAGGTRMGPYPCAGDGVTPIIR